MQVSPPASLNRLRGFVSHKRRQHITAIRIPVVLKSPNQLLFKRLFDRKLPMAKDCGRFKFISAFFFFPMRALLGRIGLSYDISEIANAYYREAFDRLPAADKAVILPHCLIGEKCKARFSKEDGVLCVKCGQCRCGEIRGLCEEKGWRFFVSPSSNFSKRLVRRKGIRAAIGGVCDFEIERGIRSTPITLRGVLLNDKRVIPQVLRMARYNCIDNDIDWEKLRRIILDGTGEL
jgi:hypothetical protein